MEFVKPVSAEGAFIPSSALRLSELFGKGDLTLHAGQSVLTLTKRQMTAMEMIQTIYSLTSLADRFTHHLLDVCEECCVCEEDGCPIEQNEYVDANPFLREAAGISPEAKLTGKADPETHSILVTICEHRHDLRDVPSDLLITLKQAGICLSELEEHLMLDDIIYNNQNNNQ